MENSLYTYLFLYFTLSSLGRFLWVLIASATIPKPVAERHVRNIVTYGSLLDFIHLGLGFGFFRHIINLDAYSFALAGLDFEIYWDIPALIFLAFSILTISLINRFSTVYLFRDPFYFKFFSIIYLLQLSLALLILTESSQSIFIGWELLGLSSVLLIAFYEYRASVLKNSLTILAIYKVSDLLLYGALLYSAADGILHYNMISNPYCLMALLMACLIKSSVFPWFWLPRAVEGPTQSTAVFYGSLATHIPIYVFINAWEGHSIHNYPYMYFMVFLILIALICASLLSHRMNDAKNSIAYSVIAQLGIIYLEVLFGFTTLAMTHCLLHGIYRTTEFLKSPSIIHAKLSLERERKLRTKPIIKNIIPEKIQQWLYKLAYNEFIIPRILMNQIESFMGLSSSRINRSVLSSYIFYSLSILLIIEIITVLFFGRKLLLIEELLILAAYCLNIMALINKYRPTLFFISIAASVIAALMILAEKIYPFLEWTLAASLLMIIYLGIMAYKQKGLLRPTENFKGQMHQSDWINFLLLILGFSIIGMPGLGTFFIWTKLEHALVPFYPGLILVAYTILSLNTIVFFRFYYVNFLGKHDELKQIKAIR